MKDAFIRNIIKNTVMPGHITTCIYFSFSVPLDLFREGVK